MQYCWLLLWSGTVSASVKSQVKAAQSGIEVIDCTYN